LVISVRNIKRIMEKKQRFLVIYTLLPYDALSSLVTEQIGKDGEAFLNHIITKRTDILDYFAPRITLANPEKLPKDSSWLPESLPVTRKINKVDYNDLKQASEDFDLAKGIPDDVVITKIIRTVFINVTIG
jgi:hypothetical protein